MAHSFLVTALQNLASKSKQDHNPMEFLNGFSPMHYAWHRTSFSLRKLGFLLYHFEVIKNFKVAQGPSIWSGRIKAFSANDFQNFGQPYNVSNSVKKGNIQSLEQFSFNIEQWHNEAHMAVGMAFNMMDEMMDPRNNIYHKQFWQLHYFINSKFTGALQKFDTQGSSDSKVSRVVNNFHSALGRI